MTAAGVEAVFRAARRAWPPVPRCWIAFSGGLDSTVLLDLMQSLRADLPPFQAIHVDHGLQARSAEWAAHCRSWCARRSVACTVVRIEGAPPAGASVEAWAREARYAALAAQLGPGELLLTAHHADDQLETFLLQALRGAGPAGLSAIAPWRAFGPGFLARPLLGATREQLAAYARARGLAWLEDPSNGDQGLDRNYLRHSVLPALRARWPQAAHTVARSARQCAAADAQLQSWADGTARAGMIVDGALMLAPWRLRAAPERELLLRHWLKAGGWPLPSARMLATIADQLAGAAPDRQVVLHYPGVEIRRHRDRAHVMVPLGEIPRMRLAWPDPPQPLELPAGLGVLSLEVGEGALDAARLRGRRLEVGFRQGGERLQLPGRRHHTALGELCRAAGMASWLRDRLPLLWVDGELAAVADRWVAAPFARPPGVAALCLHWRRARIGVADPVHRDDPPTVS